MDFRVFVSNEVLGLLNHIFQQKEEEVFCRDVNMSELTFQGGEFLSNCYLEVPFLMFSFYEIYFSRPDSRGIL